MAIFGARIFGSDGKLQSDDTFFNLTLKTKGTATATTVYGHNGMCRLYNLTVNSATMPLVALRVIRPRAQARNGPGATIIQATRSGNNWTFTVLLWNCSSLAWQFSYWVYDRPPATMPTGWGIWLGNGPANTTFLNGQTMLDFSTGAEHAFLASANVLYYESVDWDSEAQRERVYYGYDATVCWIWGDTGMMGSEGRQLIGGMNWDVSPNYGYENQGYDGGGLQVNVAGH